jgi:ribonuclease HI
MYYIFTDGACSNNGRQGAKAAYAIVLWNFPDHEEPYGLADRVPQTEHKTNQRAELSALSKAFQEIQERNIKDPITIYTDSDYGRRCIMEWGPQWKARGWRRTNASKKPIEHLDLLKPMIEFYEQNQHFVRIQHIAAHTGKKEFPYTGNALADTLATSLVNS